MAMDANQFLLVHTMHNVNNVGWNQWKCSVLSETTLYVHQYIDHQRFYIGPFGWQDHIVACNFVNSPTDMFTDKQTSWKLTYHVICTKNRFVQPPTAIFYQK